MLRDWQTIFIHEIFNDLSNEGRRTMRRTPFAAAIYGMRRPRHGRRGLFTAFLESIYRWHQERALLIVRDAAAPTTDTADRPGGEPHRPDEQEVARALLPH